MLSWIGGAIAKAAMGAATAILAKILTRELFQKEAETLLVKLLTWESTSTANKVDDALAAEVIAALKAPGAP